MIDLENGEGMGEGEGGMRMRANWVEGCFRRLLVKEIVTARLAG